MALDQFALLELLETLKAADVSDRIREAAQTIYQALIDAELGDRGRTVRTDRGAPGPAQRRAPSHPFDDRG